MANKLPSSVTKISFSYDAFKETCFNQCGHMGNEPDFDDVHNAVLELEFVRAIEGPHLDGMVTVECDVEQTDVNVLHKMDAAIRPLLMVVPEPRYPDEEEDNG